MVAEDLVELFAKKIQQVLVRSLGCCLLDAAPRAVSKTSLGLIERPVVAKLRATTLLFIVPFIWMLLL